MEKVNGVMCKQVCKVCGAVKFARPGGWGRTMAPDYKASRRYCTIQIVKEVRE